jgi:ribose transport system substrate-binding protein
VHGTRARGNWRATRLAVLAALALTVGAVAAGCSGGDGNGGGSGAVGGAGASSDNGKKPLIGFTVRFIAGNSWLQEVADGAKREGARMGYDVEALDGKGDPVRQNQQIQTFIARGAKAILVEPIDARALSSSILAAKRAGIPVVAVNDLLAPELANQVACNVHDNGPKTAELVGREVAKAVGEKYKPGQTVKLYIMAILPHEPLTTGREQGFMKGYNDYFKEHPGPNTVRITNGYGSAIPDKTLPVMRDKLAGNPDVKVIFSMTDTVHGAVMQPLIQAGFVGRDQNSSKVIIGSFDARMEVVKGMAENPGYPVVASGLDQPFAQAVLALRAADAAIKGKTPDCPGTPPTAILPSGVVTKANAKDFVNPSLAFAADGQYVK